MQGVCIYMPGRPKPIKNFSFNLIKELSVNFKYGGLGMESLSGVVMSCNIRQKQFIHTVCYAKPNKQPLQLMSVLVLQVTYTKRKGSLMDCTYKLDAIGGRLHHADSPNNALLKCLLQKCACFFYRQLMFAGQHQYSLLGLVNTKFPLMKPPDVHNCSWQDLHSFFLCIYANSK